MFFLVNKAQKPKIKEKYRRLTLVHPLQKFLNFFEVSSVVIVCAYIVKIQFDVCLNHYLTLTVHKL